MGDPLLDDLDESQRAAVTSGAAPLAIVAPAGAGKTRVLTRRIAFRAREGRLDTRHVLAVTFTRRAAGELRHRLAALGIRSEVTAGTFHALALAQLRRRAVEAGREPPVLLDAKAPLLSGLVADRAARAALAGEIEWAKARLVTPAAYEAAARRAGRRPGRALGEVAGLYERYEHEKRRRRRFDFDDLLGRCADAIDADREFAAEQRWRFRHVFVDEFQDVNPLQLRLLRAWLGPNRDLTVVGDVSQAIYGFAGADAAPLARFDEHFPGGTTLDLSVSYRSTPQVVAASRAVLPATAPGVRTARTDGPVARAVACADEADEARGVARLLEDARRRGRRYGDMAVLFRTNAQAAAFEETLGRAGIPYRVPRAARLRDRPDFRAALDALAETEKRAPGRPFADHLADLAEMAARAGDTSADSDDEDDTAPEPGSDEQDPAAPAQGAAEAADDLHTWGREYLAAEGASATLAGFRSWLSLTLREENAGRPGEAVDLLTFHRAKGLEWPLVCVTGLEEGLVPISFASSRDALDEERRLLHVALGRASEELHVSWAARRGGAGRRPSPWLPAIAAAAAPGPADRVPDPRRALAEMRRTLAARSPAPGSGSGRRSR